MQVEIHASSDATRTNALGYFQLAVLPWDTLEIFHNDYGKMLVTIPSSDAFQIPITKLPKTETDVIANNVLTRESHAMTGVMML